MGKIKSCAFSLLFTILMALATVTLTYAIIPIFAPDLAGSVAAWAFTIVALIPIALFFLSLLLIVAWKGKEAK